MGRAVSRLARWLSPQGLSAGRVAGYPTSANRASSLHLRWELPPGTGPVVAASVVLVVEAEPPVPDLYFWALQASFTDSAGRRRGGGHLGLQWHRPHPGSRAVNWGGYAAGGGELAGSASALPSATGNPNTRDLWWEPGQPHTLTIERAESGAAPGAGGPTGSGRSADGRTDGSAQGWAGTVDGVRVRTLAAGGDRLDGLMVWSEVFARCDAPPVAVRWSGFRVATADGRVVAPAAVHVNYQRRSDGGCDNTTALPDGGAVRQITGTERVVPQGARLALAP